MTKDIDSLEILFDGSQITFDDLKKQEIREVIIERVSDEHKILF